MFTKPIMKHPRGKREPEREKSGSLLTDVTKRIMIVGAAAIITAFVLIILYETYSVTLKAKENTKEAYQILVEMLRNDGDFFEHGDYDFEVLLKSGNTGDEEYLRFLAYLKRALTCICNAYDMSYLYIFDVDEEERSYTYYVLTEGTRMTPGQVKASAERQYGTKIKVDRLPEAVLQAKAGNEDTRVRIISNQFGRNLAWTYPIRDPQGKVIFLLGAEYDFYGIVSVMLFQILLDGSVIALLVFLLIILMRNMVKKRVTAPLDILSAEMDRFVEDYSSDGKSDTIPLVLKEFPGFRSEKHRDEIYEISNSFLKMSDDIDRYIQDLNTLTKERMETENQMALTKQVQDGIVPAWIHKKGSRFEMCAAAEPAKMFGGDFYDHLMLDADHLAFFLGDVSGKGINAAMFMVMVKTGLKEKLRVGMTPAKALRSLNAEVYECNPEKMFATIFAGILNLKTGEISFANAGHENPLIFCDRPYYQPMDTGLAIGLIEDVKIVGEKMQLSAGDGLLLYTDGVTDAVNPEDERFGTERLLEYAAGIRDAESAADSLRKVIDSYYAGGERFDDLTFLTLFYFGPGNQP